MLKNDLENSSQDLHLNPVEADQTFRLPQIQSWAPGPGAQLEARKLAPLFVFNSLS